MVVVLRPFSSNLHVRWEDSNKPDPDGDFGGPLPLPLRANQLVFRRHEIYIAYQAFCRFIENDRDLELGIMDEVDIDKSSWTGLDVDSGKPPVCCTADVALMGHSFGGCTVVCLCRFLYMVSVITVVSYPYFQQNPHQVMNPCPSQMPLF
jgi:hypothetical protein